MKQDTITIVMLFIGLLACCWFGYRQAGELNQVRVELAECSVTKKTSGEPWDIHWGELLSECEDNIIEYSDNAMELVCLEYMEELYNRLDICRTNLNRYQDLTHRCEVKLVK